MIKLTKEQVDPCPFCGEEIELYLQNMNTITVWFYVYCDKCDACGPMDLGMSGAIEAWNERVVVEEK